MVINKQLSKIKWPQNCLIYKSFVDLILHFSNLNLSFFSLMLLTFFFSSAVVFGVLVSGVLGFCECSAVFCRELTVFCCHSSLRCYWVSFYCLGWNGDLNSTHSLFSFLSLFFFLSSFFRSLFSSFSPVLHSRCGQKGFWFPWASGVLQLPNADDTFSCHYATGVLLCLFPGNSRCPYWGFGSLFLFKAFFFLFLDSIIIKFH